MPFYEQGDVRIYYEEAGAGFPLLLIPGGGLNSAIGAWSGSVLNAMEEFQGEYRCITMDLRNANGGQSSGPIVTENAWDSYTDDFLGLMDHLGIREFMVVGFCIGGPFILKLIERAADRIPAAVIAQPTGFRPERPNFFWEFNTKGWGAEIRVRRPEVTQEEVEAHLRSLYLTQPDFVLSVTRDFVRSCLTPLLVLPDDVVAHPWQVSMDIFKLAPNAEVSLYPWKEPPERLAATIDQVRGFLSTHTPAVAPR